jgi:hypothetical protein
MILPPLLGAYSRRALPASGPLRHTRDMQHIRILVVSLVSVCASGQTFQQTWQTLQAGNPAGAAITLRIAGTQFHQGEPVPFSVDLPKTPPSPDRIYQFGGFLLDPAAECGSLQRPCFELAPRNGPGSYSPVLHGELNGYVRSLKPGAYHLAALFVLEVLKSTGPMSRSYGYTDPRQYIVSNAVEFAIVQATAEWQRRTIAAAVKTLIEGDSYEPTQMRQAAAHQLRYIQTPQAWRAELDQLDKSEPELLAGLENASDKPTVCGMMRTRLTQPRQYVSVNYLWSMGRICGTPPDAAAADLAAHLPEKSAASQPAALNALVEFAAARQNAPPAWLAEIRRQAVLAWPQMPAYRQKLYLADWQWSVVRSPDLIPFLESLADKAPPTDAELWRLAVRRLNEFAPEKAQSRIVAEMFVPASRLDESTLALLPPQATRGLTPKIIQTLAAVQKGNGGDYHLVMSLIARFGDAASLPKIRAIFESQVDPCQPELLAYFLRVDPPYADRVLHRQPWDMAARAPVCAPRYFAVSARLSMAPPLEKFTIAYLMHGNVQVKMAAAESLGKYGSAAAEAPLWDTIRYFHEYWKDRRALLKEHPEGEYLEVALRNAIARGAGWRVAEPDIRTLASLCISERCQYETQNDLQNLQQPLTVNVEGDCSRVAQYFNIESLDALERKLAQFPAGTTFQLRVSAPDRDQVVARLQAFGSRNRLAFQLPSIKR